tara:strand:- start:10 stop:297 length:288 start_codon:yes stop_codon:yes gene_type:complete
MLGIYSETKTKKKNNLKSKLNSKLKLKKNRNKSKSKYLIRKKKSKRNVKKQKGGNKMIKANNTIPSNQVDKYYALSNGYSAKTPKSGYQYSNLGV